MWTTLIVVLCVVIGMLGFQQRDLAAKLNESREKIDSPYAGMYVPSLTLSDLEGKPVGIGSPDPEGRQILIAFNTKCPHCLASVPAFRRLHAAMNTSGRADLYLLSRDSAEDTRAYLEKNSLTARVAILKGAREVSLLHASAVPVLLVVNHDGKVIFSHAGRLDVGKDVDDVLAAVDARDGPDARQDAEGSL